jgi:AcrR family transcriptional regulator
MKNSKIKSQSRREEILNAALKCFNKKGYHKTSLDDIAAKVGVTKAALYYYFKSKKKLFIDLFIFKIETYFDDLSKNVMRSRHDPVEALMSHIERSDEIFKKNIELFKFVMEFLSISTRDQEIKSAVTRFYENRVQDFSRLLQLGIDEGKFKHCDTQTIGVLFYYLSIGSFLTYFSVNKQMDRVLHFKVFVDLFYRGIMKQ